MTDNGDLGGWIAGASRFGKTGILYYRPKNIKAPVREVYYH